jgi:hypothetical protein
MTWTAGPATAVGLLGGTLGLGNLSNGSILVTGTRFGQPPKKRVSPSSSPRVKPSPGKRPPRVSLGRGSSGDSSDSENVSLDLASMQDSLRDVESQVQATAASAPKRTHVPRSNLANGSPSSVAGAGSSSAPHAGAEAAAASNSRITRSQAKTQQTELFSPTYHLAAEQGHPRKFENCQLC